MSGHKWQMQEYGRKLLAGGFLLFLGLPAFAKEACIVKDVHEIPMPPERKQGSTGLCYTFAATQLLQHHYCATKKGGCSYAEGSKDLISVLGVAAIVNHGQGAFNSGGFTNEVLTTVSYRDGAVPREVCAPFSKILDSEKLYPQKTWGVYEIAFRASMQAADQRLPCNRRELAEALKEVMQLEETVATIQDALTKRNLQVYLGDILVADKCKADVIEIPKFKVDWLGNQQSMDEIKSTIKEKILEGRPVNVILCSGASVDSCGVHSLVVSGERMLCCAGKCEAQQRIVDSDNTFGAKRDKDGWVSRALLEQKIQLYKDFTYGKKTPAKVLTWISPR